jgi:hypothetical protein
LRHRRPIDITTHTDRICVRFRSAELRGGAGSAVGGFLARRKALLGNAPCQVAAVPRGIPELPFWAGALFLSLVIGFFSIAPASVEIFYLLNAFWRREIYCSYNLLLSTVLMMMANAGGFTVLAVYLRLQCECHRWHWFAFLVPCTNGLYTLVCCLRLYLWKVESLGWFTTASFFGTSALLSALVAIVSGACGFLAANSFIRLIFTNLKLD